MTNLLQNPSDIKDRELWFGGFSERFTMLRTRWWRSKSSGWVTSKASIIDRALLRYGGSSYGGFFSVIYSYIVGDESYTGEYLINLGNGLKWQMLHSIEECKNTYQLNSTIDICFDPKNPSRSIVKDIITLGYYPFDRLQMKNSGVKKE